MNRKTTFLEHPLYPMVMAFPMAFYAATLTGFVIYALIDDPFFFKLAVVANLAGVVIAAGVIIPGYAAWATSIPSNHPARQPGFNHLLLSGAALLLFAVNLFIHIGQWNSLDQDAGWGVLLALAGIVCCIGAGYCGYAMILAEQRGTAVPPDHRRLDRREAG